MSEVDFELLKIITRKSKVNFEFKSLILAQDERWRRA